MNMARLFNTPTVANGIEIEKVDARATQPGDNPHSKWVGWAKVPGWQAMCTRGKKNKHAQRNFAEMFFYFLTSQPVTSLNAIIVWK